MLSVAELTRIALTEGVVAMSPSGEPIDPPGDVGPGSAVLFVSGVSDALKMVTSSGMIQGSVNRDEVWAVDAVVLAADVVESLEGEFASVLDLYDAVDQTSVSWTVSPMPSGP